MPNHYRLEIVTLAPDPSVCRWLLQSPVHSRFERRYIIGYGFPDRVQIDAFIRMAKLISDTSDVPPRHFGTAPFRFNSEPDSGLADDTAATAIGFERNASKCMPDVNCSIIEIASRMSPNQL